MASPVNASWWRSCWHEQIGDPSRGTYTSIFLYFVIRVMYGVPFRLLPLLRRTRQQESVSTLAALGGHCRGQTKPAHAPTPKPETPHLRFVKEYVRELISDESLKITGQKEFGEAKTDNERF